MARQIDKESLNRTVITVVDDTFKQMCRVSFTGDPVVSEKEIIEYNGNMRVFPMEKFNGPAYLGIINYYLSQKDLESRQAVGTFILFVKEDTAERIFKAFGRPASEAEDENTVLDVIGEMCNILAGNVKNHLMTQGYADLVISAPLKYRNVVPEGAQFDYDLFTKQEIVFNFWNQKCIAVEMCLGAVPQKKN